MADESQYPTAIQCLCDKLCFHGQEYPYEWSKAKKLPSIDKAKVLSEDLVLCAMRWETTRPSFRYNYPLLYLDHGSHLKHRSPQDELAAEQEKIWLFAADSLDIVNDFLKGPGGEDEVRKMTNQSKSELVDVFRQCIWAFLAQGDYDLFCKFDKRSRPDIIRIKTLWGRGETLGSIMKAYEH